MQTTTPSRRPTGTRVLPSTGGRLAPWSPFLGGLGLVLLLTPMGLLRTGQAQETAGWTDLRGRSSYSLEEFAQALFPAAAPLVQTRGIGPPKTSTGLPVARVSVVLNVLFASNTEVIPSTAYADIDKLGTLLSWPQYADYGVQLEGHTDSQGAARKNLALSEKRVQSLKHYLVERFHVVPERVRAVGYGASRPLATNATPEGRSQNRRVEVVNLGPGQ